MAIINFLEQKTLRATCFGVCKPEKELWCRGLNYSLGQHLVCTYDLFAQALYVVLSDSVAEGVVRGVRTKIN